MLALDEERAIAALPKLAPDMRNRRRGFDAARSVMSARGELTADQEERFRRVANILGLDGAARGHRHERGRRRRRGVRQARTRAGVAISHEKYQRLIDAAKALPPVTTAVVHPCDESSLSGAVDAAKLGLDQADPRRTAGEDRSGRRSSSSSTSRATSWSTSPHSHAAAARGRAAGRAGAGPRR